MGTFLGCVGTPHIPEERQKEFRGRMLRLLREGGMMNTEEVNLFGKKISLLHFPEPDEDGFFQVCYNYFENDCWEDAGMYRGHVYSGKVGWRQFCRVVAAARILEERSSDALCFADLRDADIPHFFPLGWLKYLFGEELPLDSPSLWDTYLFLKDAGRYDGSEDSWNQILIRNAGSFPDWMDILAIRTAEHGTEAVLGEIMQYYEENVSEKEPSEEDSLVSDYAALRKQIGALPEQLPGAEDEQLSQVMAYLTEPDSDTLFSMVLDESQPEALRRLPFMQCYLPRQIIVKAVAETYHQDFRELWEQAKTGYAHWFYQESTAQGRTPIEPIPTDVYLRITPEDRLFSLPPEALDTLTSETQVWLKGLRGRFEESLHGPKPYADGLSFQRSMLGTLSKQQERNNGVFAFRDMFYEFLANWQQPAYQSLWALFVEMAGAEDADPARLRQYLALLANPPLRKAVFGV